MKPMRDYLFVLQDETRDDITQAGIIVKASKGIVTSQEQLGRYGTIVDIGPEVDRDQLKIGDRICYGEFEYPKYREYIVMRDKDIVGVVE